MCENSREFYVLLDASEKNKIYIKYAYSADFLSIDEFVLIYLTSVDGVFKEVVKYDYSQKEPLHVHYYFEKNARKEYLDLLPTIDTIINLHDKICSNWQKYLLKSKEQ